MPLPPKQPLSGSASKESSSAPEHATTSDGKHAGRKSSLATSLQNFASRTFHSLPRRINPRHEAAADATTVTPNSRHASAKFPVSRSPSKLPTARPRPATSSTGRMPSSAMDVPPMPPLIMRTSGTRIPTLSRIPALSAQGARATNRVNPISPQPKPFVAYEDVKALSGALNGGKSNQNKAAPETPKRKGKKVEAGGDIEEAKSADSTPLQKHAMSFSRRRTPTMITAQKIQTSDRLIPKSMSMATLSRSHRVSTIPPVPSFHSLDASQDSQIKSPSTRSTRVVTQSGQSPDRSATRTSRASSTASRATSLKCDPRDRELPLPPIPALPKSYSIGNIRIHGRSERPSASPRLPLSPKTPVSPKTPISTHTQKNRISTLSHAHGTPKSAEIKTHSPSGAALNCYVTANYSTAPQTITEPLIELTPPRQTLPTTPAGSVSASPITPSSATGEKLEENVSLVRHAQTEQYWLGRFSTLLNSFQYEEAFNAPDPFISYHAPPRTKFLKACGIESIDEFNIKRAFTALERVCMTTEAAKSLHEFKDAYESKFTKSGTPKPVKGDAKAKLADGRQTAIRVHNKNVEKTGQDKECADAGNAGEFGIRNLIKSVRKGVA
ncbi:hypothetical protein PRK78_004850 [Emydomyces testavorans]|uniref:Uncharacterized protein n=1 Tax=Emydomyces testavorans TaxID=2070801 RepID=A0AAF0DIG7_9EURO|nr:hypothetical protein PRK78_004850 [Emydomyces testavorans]